MPNASTRQTIARQWEILKALPRRGAGMGVAELESHLRAHGFEASARTLQRDLVDLAQAFRIECNNKSKPFGWRWEQGAAQDLLGLTAAEAVSLHLVEQAIRPVLPAAIVQSMVPRFEQARQKLASLELEAGLSALAAHCRFVSDGAPLHPPHIDEAVLQSVQDALGAAQQLSVRYHSAAQLAAAEEGQMPEEAPAMRLHPLALINRGPVIYLLATCWDYDDPRLFALHRLHSAERTYEPARRPAGFVLDEWLQQHGGQFGSGECIALQARVGPELAVILRETPLAEDQCIEPGTGLLTATVADTWQLQWWLLSQGDAIEVLSPPALRQRVGESLRRAAQRYEAC